MKPSSDSRSPVTAVAVHTGSIGENERGREERASPIALREPLAENPPRGGQRGGRSAGFISAHY